MDPRVSEAMAKYTSVHFGNPHANHAFGWQAQRAIELATQRISDAVRCDPDEIVFTSGATEANNLAILGLAARKEQTRNRILFSAIEHKCVLESARVATERFRVQVEVIPVDADGLVSMDYLERSLSDDVLLVSVNAVNNEIGTVQPLKPITELCQRFGAVVHTDAAHALTTRSVDVNEWGVDLLSLSSHKVYGPMGIGALYIRRDIQDRLEPLIYGGGQQRGLRSGTVPVPLCVGFGTAVALAVGANSGAERERIGSLRDSFVARLLKAIPNSELNGPAPNSRHCGNANIRFCGHDGHDLLDRLAPAIAASTGSACMSGAQEPSHVLRAIGLSDENANSSIRFGFGRFTTEEEITTAARAIIAVVLEEQTVAS